MPVFIDLTKEQAEEYLENFLADMGRQLRWLAAQVAGEVALEPGVSALQLAWTHLATQASWRPGYEPAGFGEPPVPVPSELVGVGRARPSWADDRPREWLMMSDETLWLVDAVGRLYGESLVAACDKAAWSVGDVPGKKNYIYRNHPVITGLPDDVPVAPLSVCGNLVLAHLWDAPSKRSLLDVMQAVLKP